MTPLTTMSPGTPCQMKCAVRLQCFAQRLRHGVAQPRLERFVVKRQNFDGFVPGDRVIDRPKMVTGATAKQKCGAHAEKAPEISGNAFSIVGQVQPRFELFDPLARQRRVG